MTRPISPVHLAELRHERGLTQAALSELAGVTRVTISNLESGQPPRLSTAVALAEALGVPFMIVAPPDGSPVELWVIDPHDEHEPGRQPGLARKGAYAAPSSGG